MTMPAKSMMAETAKTIERAYREAQKEKIRKKSDYTLYRSMRITTYCAGCNSPAGHSTSSGGYARAGTAASGDPALIGETVKIDGNKYYVNDKCGVPNTIDIFVETETCRCSLLMYRPVYVRKERDNDIY